MALLIGCVVALLPTDAFCTRALGELEKYQYDDLVLVGTFQDKSGWAGCVRLPDKSLRLVRPEYYIGPNDGKITAIEKNRFDLVELVPDGSGGWLERELAWGPKLVGQRLDKACHRATDVEAEWRKQSIAEAEAKAKDTLYADATRHVRNALMDWRWKSHEAPRVDEPHSSSWQTVWEVLPYASGFLIVARDWRASYVQAWHDGIYFLASPQASLQQAHLDDCQTLVDVVVRDGVASWLCFHLADKWTLVTTRPDGAKLTTKLPFDAEWIRLGIGSSGLLAVTPDSVYRQKGSDWQRVFHAPAQKRSDLVFSHDGNDAKHEDYFLPQRGFMPIEHAGYLYLPASDERNGRVLYRLRLKDGAALENFSDILSEEYFGDQLFTLSDITVDEAGSLWIAGEPGAVVRIRTDGKLRLGATFGDVAFRGPMSNSSGNEKNDRNGKLPTAAILRSGAQTFLANGDGLVQIDNDSISPVGLLHAMSCRCRMDPRRLARFADGMFVIAPDDGGLYLLGSKSGLYKFSQPQVSQNYVKF